MTKYKKPKSKGKKSPYFSMKDTMFHMGLTLIKVEDVIREGNAISESITSITYAYREFVFTIKKGVYIFGFAYMLDKMSKVIAVGKLQMKALKLIGVKSLKDLNQATKDKDRMKNIKEKMGKFEKAGLVNIYKIILKQKMEGNKK